MGRGSAVYDPHADREVAARAYLPTFGQLSDVVSQEVWRPIDADLALTGGADGQWAIPSETYETLLQVGERDGVPMFAITCLLDLEPTPPSAPYLRTLLDGLGETFGWSCDERVRYLLRAPGVTPAWTASRLIELYDGESSGRAKRAADVMPTP